MAPTETIDHAAGRRALLGAAIGDSLGLPYEGLPAGRGARLMPFPLRQRLFGATGSTSDDAFQSGLALAALARHPDDPDRFAREFARGLRRWFLAAPPGIGLSTAKACLRLCGGVPAARSGVRSAGNGAAMRSAVLGAALHADPERRIAFIAAGARVTHTHEFGVAGAQLVALAAALAASGGAARFESEARTLAPDWPWDFPVAPNGPTGYVVPSVNAALRLWREHSDDLPAAIEAAVRLGGDTDTVAAIVGGIVAASPAAKPVPPGWRAYRGWPSPAEIEGDLRPPGYLRTLAHHGRLLPVVLVYGFRRLLPPY